MGIVSDLLRAERQRLRRLEKVYAGLRALNFNEKTQVAAKLFHELEAGPPKPSRHRKAKSVASPPKPVGKTVRELVTAALSQHAPLSAAGVHAVIERTVPGTIHKGSVAAEISVMVAKGLVIKAGIAGRGASYALANGRGGAH